MYVVRTYVMYVMYVMYILYLSSIPSELRNL